MLLVLWLENFTLYKAFYCVFKKIFYPNCTFLTLYYFPTWELFKFYSSTRCQIAKFAELSGKRFSYQRFCRILKLDFVTFKIPVYRTIYLKDGQTLAFYTTSHKFANTFAWKWYKAIFNLPTINKIFKTETCYFNNLSLRIFDAKSIFNY